MDNIEENEYEEMGQAGHVAMPRRHTRIFSKVLAISGGITAGLVAGISSLNSIIFRDISVAAKPGFDKLDKMTEDLEKGFYSEVNSPIRKYIHDIYNDARMKCYNAIHGRYGSDPMRSEMTRDGTAMNSAFKSANSRFAVDFEDLEKRAAHIRKTIVVNGQIPEQVLFDQLGRAVVDAERMRFANVINDMPNHIPVSERLKMLAGQVIRKHDKATVGLAFAGVAIVTAGAIYYGINALKNKSENNAAQASGI